ncbi:hypothetical protein FoTM2_013500 [Fusarium oxysporum f. sp. vasinfectum]|nr:hypothetical protein FoTM2_013500 [Fusarium oxysporum f. sp. vasinfectum]
MAFILSLPKWGFHLLLVRGSSGQSSRAAIETIFFTFFNPFIQDGFFRFLPYYSPSNAVPDAFSVAFNPDALVETDRDPSGRRRQSRSNPSISLPWLGTLRTK